MQRTRKTIGTPFSLAMLGLICLGALLTCWHFSNQRAAAAQTGPISPDSVWTDTGRSGQKRSLRLNSAALTPLLGRAPQEAAGRLAGSSAIIALPMPGGEFARFRIVDSPIMAPALAAKFPQIKSYAGQGIDDPRATMRLSWSPRGLSALVLGRDYSVSIEPENANNPVTYISSAVDDEAIVCRVTKAGAAPVRPNAIALSVGAQLRKFRLAVAATGEYTVANGGVAGALAQINAEINAVNTVYERELAIRLELIANNNLIIFTDQFADGYTNGDTAAMINENQTVLDAAIGAANYDVGHVFGTGGGGQALLGVVCAAGKAAGASLFTGTTLNTRLTAHEIGHQFGADHSYNSGTGAFCGGQRAPNAASETGGGASIMAYIKCQDTGLDDSIVNIFAASNLRFHNGSFTQITNYIGTTSCATTMATGNTPPTVSAGPGYTIPRNTPFTLTATGSDADQADQNNLTYDWEQLDAGGVNFAQNGTAAGFSDAGDPPNTTRPIFRPFPATTSPSRTFPSLQYILNNANVPPATITIPGTESQGGGTFHTAENLPNVSRTLKFRVTVRDNRAGGGGTTDAETTLTVSGASGPFNVTAPNGGEMLTGGSPLTVTWNVAGTATAPVNAANVKITLSADGGQTFPVTLTASTPNDGSEMLTVPGGILSTAVRLKIEAVGNIFFDVSNANFSIAPGGACTAVSSIAPGIGNVGQDVILTGVNFTGVTAVKFSGNIEATNLIVVSDTTITLKVPAGATTGSLTLVKAGCGEEATPYIFTVCTNQPVALLVDDDSAELDVNAPTADNYFVNRLTPGAYPATLQSVRILFRNAPPGAISILAGTNTDGNGEIDNTVYQTVSATAPVLNQFNEYFFPPITITSGDFVVGFRMPGPVASIMATDTNGANQQRSYVSPDGTGYFNFPFGNFLIRAGIFAGACGSVGGGNCPVVNDIAPTSGAVGSQVTINGTNLDGVTAVTFGGGVNAVNPTITATQITATVPAGAMTGAITLTKPNCGAVTTPSFTVSGCPTITVSPAGPGLPAGTVGTAYTQTFSQMGGAGTIAWSASAGTLPDGLTLNNTTGELSGAPATAGSSTFTIRATDENNCTGEREYTLTVNPATCPTIEISPFALQAGTVNVAFSATFTATPTDTYTFTVVGALPAGLTLTATSGELSGTPTVSGTFNFTIKATDGNMCVGTKDYSLQIFPACPTITILPASLPPATVGTLYNQTFSSTPPPHPQFGGWSLDVGSNPLPTGLNLSNTGQLSGTPTTAGTFTFTVHVLIEGTCSQTKEYTLTINPPSNGLQFFPLPQPVRLLETRAGFSGCTNPGNPINANDTFTLPARTPCAGIPANAAAITGNITVVPSQPGFLTLFPSTATQPQVANSNFAAGEITNNVFTVGLGAGDGAFKIFTNATTHIIADVTGYYAPPGTGGLYFHPLATPVRLLETRTGFTGCFAPGTPLAGTGDPNADPNLDLPLQGRSPIPSPCNSIPATAQVLVGNATSVLPTGGGYLTIYPSGGTRPTVASSNYAGGDVINGPFAVKLGADGKFKIYTFATTHLVVDILGYYSEDANDVNGAGLFFNPLPSPVRLLETRPDFPGFPLTGCTRTNAKIQGNLATATHTQSAGGFCGLPSTAQAVVGNVSVVNSEGAGFLTLFPANLTTAPLVATSNYPAPATFGYNRHYFVGLSPVDGKFKVLTQFTTDLILDASGYFAP